MHALSPAEYRIAAPVFEPMSHHLAMAAILNGAVPARVYVDDPAHPRTAMAWYAHRMHLAGAPDNRAFNLALGRLFAEAIRPQLLAGGNERVTLYYIPSARTALKAGFELDKEYA
jgi:hypothetical protein